MSLATALAETLRVTGAGADSLGATLRLADVHELIEKWHDFFLMTGTASVTLAGLLFIALSLHMEVLVQERFSGMLLVARIALTSFILVMIVSIVMLVPLMPVRPLGLMLIVFVAIFSFQTVREFLISAHHDHQDFPHRTVRRRALMPVLGNLFIGLAGYGLFTRNIELLYQMMVGGMVMLLVNAAYASWDLLVRVSRAKTRDRAH